MTVASAACLLSSLRDRDREEPSDKLRARVVSHRSISTAELGPPIMHEEPAATAGSRSALAPQARVPDVL